MVTAEVWGAHISTNVIGEKNKAEINNITGDLNFSNTDLKQMRSTDKIDSTWLNYFIDENFKQILNFSDLFGYKNSYRFS